jgi:hypothetical protein
MTLQGFDHYLFPKKSVLNFMQINQDLFCYPTKDKYTRFILGKKGKRNLLCIGLNPNSADEDGLDPTSRNVKKIALNNGYDGWFLVNLYPQRAKNVSELDIKPDQKIFWQNIFYIKELLRNDDLALDTAWLAWGNDIDSFYHDYLKHSAYYLYSNLESFELDFVCAGMNKSGHPTHPSPQAIAQKFRKKANDVKLKPFDYKAYTKHIKQTTNIPPEISIDGRDVK